MNVGRVFALALAIILLVSCACGEEAGQKCCEGNECGPPWELVCDTETGRCVPCGAPGELCCLHVQPISQCDSGHLCDESGICRPCGEIGQLCCSAVPPCNGEYVRCARSYQTADEIGVCELPLEAVLLPAAGELCDRAAASGGGRTSPEPALLYVINKVDEGGGWGLMRNASYFPHQPEAEADLTTVVCITEDLVPTGEYTDGTHAYRRDWSVRLVSHPDGLVLAEAEFEGIGPPSMALETGEDIITKQPRDDFLAWLEELLPTE